MKRCLAILILLALLPVSVQAGSAPHTVKTNSVPVYCTDDRDIRSAQDMVLIPDHPLYYLDGVGDLPYADLKDFVGLMNRVAAFDARVDRRLYIRRLGVSAGDTHNDCLQLDMFTDYAALQNEEKIQRVILAIRRKYGSNAILKGMNYLEGATARERNTQIGGHRA